MRIDFFSSFDLRLYLFLKWLLLKFAFMSRFKTINIQRCYWRGTSINNKKKSNILILNVKNKRYKWHNVSTHPAWSTFKCYYIDANDAHQYTDWNISIIWTHKTNSGFDYIFFCTQILVMIKKNSKNEIYQRTAKFYLNSQAHFNYVADVDLIIKKRCGFFLVIGIDMNQRCFVFRSFRVS